MADADRVGLRVATEADVPRLRGLIELSARELSRGYYDEAQIAAALAHVFGVDSTLIADGTYFVAELAGDLVGCGGWSKRRTLFGGDQYAARDSGLADPALDAAKIRAFFVHPRAARMGVGRALLKRCEAEAKAAGFRRAELMSTLPGVSFYQACGYTAGELESFTVTGGVGLGFRPMSKPL